MNGTIASAIAEWSVAYARAVAAQRWADGLLAAMVVWDLVSDKGGIGARDWAHRGDGCFDRLPEADRLATLRQLRSEARRIANSAIVGEPVR